MRSRSGKRRRKFVSLVNRERRLLGLADLREIYRYSFLSGTTLLATDRRLAPPPVEM